MAPAALLDGYPLVFSDTGTYLAQAIEHYVGWDRPVFYSLFLLPLHMTSTTWPAIIVQALLIAHVLHLVRRTLLPQASVWWLVPLAGAMSVASSLPWIASQLAPDVFTGVLVLVLALLIFVPDRLALGERIWLVAFAAFMIATHLSHVLLAFLLLVVLLPFRPGGTTVVRSIAPLALAVIALVSVNLLAFGRASLAPFGNMFLLTRVIYDGPGMDALRRDCPSSGWRLCAFIDRMPTIEDDFLWREDGPVAQVGGAKLVSSEANAIIGAALRAEPSSELLAFAHNSMRQLARFATGDGLQPWPATVTPVIQRDFPQIEMSTYATSRQTVGGLTVPDWMQTLHIVTALAGVAGCCAMLLTSRHHPSSGFAAAALLALLANAAITGGLSGPHDRYQSSHHVAAATGRGHWRRLAATTCPRTCIQPMKQCHAANVFWSGLEAAVSALLSFASAFIVARLVGPAEVGIGAAAIALHVLLWVSVNALFADALVQRGIVEDDTFSSAFVASIAVGCIAALLQAAFGRPLAWSLADNRLVVMSLVLALPLPLVGAAGPVQGLLTRNRAYRTLAWRTVIGQGLGTLTGVLSALAGAGAWALVLQQVVISGAGALTLLLWCPLPPHRRLSTQRLRELLRIGLPLTASTLVQHGRYRLFALLIGGTAGAAALGQVHMAFRLVDAVRELAFTAQWRLMLPVLSQHQNALSALRASMDRCLAWSSFLAFPLCAGMAVAMQPLVAALLGPAWASCGEAALPLIALTAWLFLAFPAGVAVIARGEPRYTLIANIAGTAATAAGVLLLRPATPLQAVLVWLGAQVFVSPYVLWANAHVLGTTLLRPIRAGAPLLAASLLATIAAFALPQAMAELQSPASLMALRVLIALAVGVPTALLLSTAPGGLFGRAPASASLQR